jgi:hypothetical protein
MSITMFYTATSLQDIADTFDERADVCLTGAQHTSHKGSKTSYLIQADVWKAAAEIIRNTTIRSEDKPPTEKTVK